MLALLILVVFLGAKGTTRLPLFDWRSYAILVCRKWHEPKARRVAEAILGSRGGAAIDAGAWVGDLCISLAETFPDSYIHAIEPSHQLSKFVSSVGRANGLSNLNVIQAVLSDEDGVPHATEKGESPAATYAPSDVGEVYSTTVDSLRASGRIQRLGFIHLDVEGAELLAVRGSLGTLEKDRPHILVETLADRSNLEKIRGLVQELGYDGGRTIAETACFGDFLDKNKCRNVLFSPDSAPLGLPCGTFE